MPTVTETAVSTPEPRSNRAARVKLLAILAVCAAPVIASYFLYYVVRPDGRTNYGDLVDPQRPVGGQGGVTLAGQPRRIEDLGGHWVYLAVADAACDKACADRLWAIRQVRLTTGKDMERIERLLLLTADAPAPSAQLLAEHPGLEVIRLPAGKGLDWLPVSAADGTAPADHIYVIDPLGNLMMRYRRDADPNKMKKDIAKLLRASRLG